LTRPGSARFDSTRLESTRLGSTRLDSTHGSTRLGLTCAFLPQWKQLHHAGHLNDEQYEAAKARLLGIPAVHGSVQTAVPVGAVQAVHAIPMPAGFAGGQGVVMATAVPMQAV